MLRAAVTVLGVMMVCMAQVNHAARTNPAISRAATIPQTAADAQQNTIENTLDTILRTMRNDHRKLESSVQEVKQELSELREETDLILGKMYKPSCQEVAEDLHSNAPGSTNEATVGVYTIKPPKYKPTLVRCELSRGAVGWTVILSRSSGRERFNRTYRQYQDGFGDPSEEYWIGNDLLHRLTTWRPHQLRVALEDFNGQKAWAQYKVFRVGGPEENYQLTVDQFEADSNAGDGLKIHNGMKFSTYDKDDDTNKDGNCSQLLGGYGGWWYSNCYHVLPTGRYRSVGGNEYGGVAWHPWRDVKHSIKAMTLLIRAH